MKLEVSRSFAVFTLGFALAACSSASKQGSNAASQESAGAAEVSNELGVEPKKEAVNPDLQAPPATAESSANPVPAIPVSPKKDVSLDPKYKVLAQLIRDANARPGAVQEEATRLLGTNQYDPVALNALALIHLRRGRPGAAKLLLLRALEKNPLAALQNNLGVALLDEGDREGAVLHFKKALQLDDRHAESMANLGSIYAQNGDYVRARSLLESAYRQNKWSVQVANNYALALRANNDLDGARKVYEEAIKINSRDVNTLLNYAILLIEFMNKPKDGLDYVYKVKFLETERKDVLSRANALEKKAKSELK